MRSLFYCSIILTIALSGCTSIPVAPSSPLTREIELPTPSTELPDDSAPSQPVVQPLATSEVGVTGEVPADLLAAILTDAAAKTGLGETALAVIQAQAVIWPDGSLGCPQPGMVYTQALVDGYHILIQAGDQVLDYRATQRGSFVLCESELRTGPVQTPVQ